ncbi:MAG: GNAT family N-acetyltransferase [Kineosporiaceae bacterium]|nr:GNAT family N-acetyltransferase [Kineosporiaceae bacterium]MBK7623627.1 GNAT family N-acetyltransferase [Kineosporiaceae bacterium]MBK8077972.1 GNAT family N-acetyltransferase [Kineosporiaceae bacterium]
MGFLHPFSLGEASAFWRRQLPGRTIWLARGANGGLDGCVQLARTDYPNGRHRGEVVKLLVHRRARRRGLARALMTALEDAARTEGLTLLLLDTETDNPAETLYRSLGWHPYGVVPAHSARPDGVLAPTTFYCKHLG